MSERGAGLKESAEGWDEWVGGEKGRDARTDRRVGGGETEKRFLLAISLSELAARPAGFSSLPDDLPRETATRTSFWHFAAQRLLNI